MAVAGLSDTTSSPHRCNFAALAARQRVQGCSDDGCVAGCETAYPEVAAKWAEVSLCMAEDCGSVCEQGAY